MFVVDEFKSSLLCFVSELFPELLVFVPSVLAVNELLIQGNCFEPVSSDGLELKGPNLSQVHAHVDENVL